MSTEEEAELASPSKEELLLDVSYTNLILKTVISLSNATDMLQ